VSFYCRELWNGLVQVVAAVYVYSALVLVYLPRCRIHLFKFFYRVQQDLVLLAYFFAYSFLFLELSLQLLQLLADEIVGNLRLLLKLLLLFFIFSWALLQLNFWTHRLAIKIWALGWLSALGCLVLVRLPANKIIWLANCCLGILPLVVFFLWRLIQQRIWKLRRFQAPS